MSDTDPAHTAENKKLKAQLRIKLRNTRRSLSRGERKAADRRLCANIRRVSAYRRARTVAAFVAFDGEPSLAELFVSTVAQQRRFCVPVIQATRMSFAPLDKKRRMLRNSFGISEPRHRLRVCTSDIDVVLVPLVGFDDAGNRLGMGGGFYDRHFSFLKSRTHYLRPRLIGVAYESQRVAELPKDSWDVPLWAVVTDRRIRRA